MRGSTRKRGSSWTCYWSTTDPASGKRVQHTKGGFRTQREAQKHLGAILESVQAGAWKPDAKLTVAELLEQWLAAKTSEGIRPATLSLYRMAAEKWLTPRIGAVEARALTASQLGHAVEQLRGPNGSALGRGPLSDRSVQIAVTVLKAATAWAAATGLIARDPLIGYRRPRAESPTMQAWSTAQARQFLGHVAGDRLAVGFALALGRGMRRGEIVGLRWQEVDLDAGSLRVATTRICVDGKAVQSAPKTARGRRTVPLDGTLVEMLKAHRKHQLEDRLASGGAYQDDGWVFADELGAPIYPDTLAERFEKLAGEAGLPRIRFHDTRHTAATLLLKSGTPVHVVAGILGHDPAMTLRVYAHVLPGQGEEAGEQLSRALLG